MTEGAIFPVVTENFNIQYTADHPIRKMIRGQRLVSEVMSPEMGNFLQIDTNNVNYVAHSCTF